MAKEAGKGDTLRPINRKKWEGYWRRYCKNNGHTYAGNKLCIYCGKENNGRART